jgi:DNA-binding NarL/FixJ family response regulator
MNTHTKHVVFYCDDCSLLEPVIKVFTATQPNFAVQTSSNINDLILKVKSGRPELILVYLHDPKESYVGVLKEIREHVDFSSIPVIIYRELPDARELEQVFLKMGKP